MLSGVHRNWSESESTELFDTVLSTCFRPRGRKKLLERAIDDGDCVIPKRPPSNCMKRVSSSSRGGEAIGVLFSSFEQPKSREISCRIELALLFNEKILPTDLERGGDLKSGATFMASLLNFVLCEVLDYRQASNKTSI